MLVPSVLKAELLTFFGHAPDSYAACGVSWADAVGAYAASITPPSTTVAAATAALGLSLGDAFAKPLAMIDMEVSFAQFAVTLGGGMAGYVATPPPGLVGFATAFAAPVPTTHDEAATRISQLIDTWMRTGLATLAVPPGTVVPWA